MNKKIYYLLITFVFSLFFFVRCTDDYITFDESNKDHNHSNEKLNSLLSSLNLNSEDELKEHISNFIDSDFKLNIDFHNITETKNKDGIVDKIALYAENSQDPNDVFYNIVFVKKNDEIVTYLVSFTLDKSSETKRFVTKVEKSNNKRQSRCGGNEYYTVEMFSCIAEHSPSCSVSGCCNACWRLVGQGFTQPEECDNPFPFEGSGDGGGSNGGSPNYSPEYLRLNNMIFEMNVKFGYKLTQPQWDNFHNYPAILAKFHSSVMSSKYSNATYLSVISYLNNSYIDTNSVANYFNQNPQDLDILFTLGTNFFNQNPNISWEDLKYLLHNKTSYESSLGDIDNNTIGGYDNTFYPDFDFQTHGWPDVSPIISKDDFIGWSYPGINRNCMDYAKAQIAIKGYAISNYYDSGQTFQIYTSNNGVNSTELSKGVSYLKYALTNNIPVIVGVDFKLDSPNPGTDNTTDHFVVIVGMGSDAKGMYLIFYDNAVSDPNEGANVNNRLYYNSTTKKFQGQSQSTYGVDKIYTITMIRKSKKK